MAVVSLLTIIRLPFCR